MRTYDESWRRSSVSLGSAFLTKNKVDDVVIFNQYLAVTLQTILSFLWPLLHFQAVIQCSFKCFKNNSK